MEKRRLGKTGLLVSLLGFGGAEIGFANVEKNQASYLLNRALDAGLNVVDTAECYMTSEQLIGETISHRRSDYYLFTKCGHEDMMGSEDWTNASLTRTLDRSLNRLKTDYIDLLQLHSCDEQILKKGEAIEFLQRAKEQGKTRFIGYSGDSLAAKYAVDCGAFDTLQTSVSIMDQEALTLTLPKAAAQGMGVIAKRPIANAVWRYESRPTVDYHLPYWERLNKLNYNFDNSENIAEIALRFTLSIDAVATMIVGTTNENRWLENREVVKKGRLAEDLFNSIRTRWQEVATHDWIGQI